MRVLHAALLAFASARGCIQVAMMGDSNTRGYAPEESYPSQTGQKLGDRWCVTNYGVGGRTILPSSAYSDTPEFEDALEDGFDVLVISLGTNDCKFDEWTDKDDVKEKYKALMGTIMDKKPGVKAVWIAYPPPLLRKDKKWDIECIRSPQEVRGVVNDVHSWFRDTYSTLYVGKIDFFEALGGDDVDHDDFKDVVHPSSQGYEKMASYAARALEKWDGREPSPSDPDADEYPPTYNPTVEPTDAAPATYEPSYEPSNQPTAAQPTRIDKNKYQPTYRPTYGPTPTPRPTYRPSQQKDLL
mmetsp:Transcript_8798/g.27466  ORF Transcript_8798/g.27466 Transcript_8798/m.27466 type:complete len:299 (+) Transcript_8798:302-1198(+)